MKIALIADVHLGHTLYGIQELHQNNLDLFEAAIDTCIREQASVLAVIGDLFDTQYPADKLVVWVAKQVQRAHEHGVMVCGIAGDHDKPNIRSVAGDGTWLAVVGIRPISEHPLVVGVDYSDAAEDVREQLQKQLREKPTAQVIVAHGQEASLFPFTEEKKDLKLTELVDVPDTVKAIVLGDIHSPLEGTWQENETSRPVPIGYTGSLGNTSIADFAHLKTLVIVDTERHTEKLSRVSVTGGRTAQVYTLDSLDTPYVANVREQVVELNKLPPKERPFVFFQYGTALRAVAEECVQLLKHCTVSRATPIRVKKTQVVEAGKKIEVSQFGRALISQVLNTTALDVREGKNAEVVSRLLEDLLYTKDTQAVLFDYTKKETQRA